MHFAKDLLSAKVDTRQHFSGKKTSRRRHTVAGATAALQPMPAAATHPARTRWGGCSHWSPSSPHLCPGAAARCVPRRCRAPCGLQPVPPLAVYSRRVLVPTAVAYPLRPRHWGRRAFHRHPHAQVPAWGPPRLPTSPTYPGDEVTAPTPSPMERERGGRGLRAVENERGGSLIRSAVEQPDE